MGKTTKSRWKRPSAAKESTGAQKRRVNQEAIDGMAELRRQGLSFAEIGTRLACSERTVRRYVSHVRPQLHLPQAAPEPVIQDPRRLRETLARGFSESLYRAEDFPQPRLSVTFLAEATKVVQDCLEGVSPLTLELMSRDRKLRKRYLEETVGPLFMDYRSHVLFDMEFGCLEPRESALTWKPPRERPEVLATDEEIRELEMLPWI